MPHIYTSSWKDFFMLPRNIITGLKLSSTEIKTRNFLTHVTA